MQIIKNKLVVLIISLFAVTSLNIPIVTAQGGQNIICRGDRDWGTFISSVISYDGFVDYWDDIFIKYNTSICHYTDIDNLIKRITKARKQIRNAFYACADTTRMKKTYYELEIELYFLRHYIDTSNGNFLVVKRNQLYQDMYDNFVINANFVTQQDLDVLFEKFKARYEPKLETYRTCKDPSWQGLIDKLNEFWDNAGGITPAINQAADSAKKRWERMEKVSLNLDRDFFGGFVDANINGLPPKEGIQQIGQELEKVLPEGYTFDQLEAAKDYKDQVHSLLSSEAEHMAEYKGLYQATSDKYTQSIIYKLTYLQFVIKDTFKYENQTINCVKSIKDKQC